MLYALDLYLKLCLRRLGPQDMPPSGRLLLGTVAADLAVGYVALHRLGPAPAVLFTLLLGAGLALGFALLALQLRGHPRRFQQTAIALFGTDLLLSALALPFNLALNAGGEAASGVQLGLLVIIAWDLMVLAHIFRHALELPRLGAWLVGLAYFFISSLAVL